MPFSIVTTDNAGNLADVMVIHDARVAWKLYTGRARALANGNATHFVALAFGREQRARLIPAESAKVTLSRVADDCSLYGEVLATSSR